MKSFKALILAINPNADQLLCDITEDFVLRSYNEHHRYYHNLDKHILPGLRLISNIQGLCQNALYVELAWWYHDVIYVPGSDVNEQASAARALFDCTLLGIDKQISNINEPYLASNYIAFLVNITDHSKEKYTIANDANLLIDVDFSILASSFDDYAAYVLAVRKEYSHISEELFIQGRKKFLTDLLSRDTIFRTEYFKNDFEKQAQENVKEELAALS